MAHCTDRPTAAAHRRPTLLIVGCGDVGLRVLRLLRGRWRVLALTLDAGARARALRAAGARAAARRPRPAGDARPAGRPGRCGAAPGAAAGAAARDDPRTAHLLQALARGGRVRRIVYASTSGVYGDCGGARVDETRAVAPGHRPRAPPRRRRGAAAPLRPRAPASRVSVLRMPGIYALDRAGGDPRERLRARHAGAAPRPTTSTPTTSTPTTWRAPASPRCSAAGRSASSTSATTASCGWATTSTSPPTCCGLPRPPRISRGRSGDDAHRRCR